MTISGKDFVAIKSSKIKPANFKIINKLIGLLLLISIPFHITTIHITLPFIPVIIIINHLILPFFSRHHSRTGTLGKTLIIIRSAAVIMTLGLCMFPVICLGFKHNKAMYPIKKAVFSTGKCSDFPDLLPVYCNDYTFFTEGQAIAQDYRACAYLAFHTDKDSMKQMENDIIAKGGVVNDYSLSLEEFFQEKLSHTPENEKKYLGEPYNQMPLYMEQKGLPIYVYNWIENINMNGSLGNASVYKNKGCLFNYETGLVVFWT